jgi:hypothetical protein
MKAPKKALRAFKARFRRATKSPARAPVKAL